MPEWLKDWWPVAIVVVPALWVAFTYFDKRRREEREGAKAKPGQPTVSASNGGVAAGGNMTGNTITTNRGPDEPKA